MERETTTTTTDNDEETKEETATMDATSAAAFAVNDYSYTQSHAVEDSIELLAGRGHRVFELMVYPGHLWPDDLGPAARSALRRRISRARLSESFGRFIMSVMK